MKSMVGLSMLVVLVFLLACNHRGARSEKSFDEIRRLIRGRTASEIEGILGAPDSRQSMPLSGERWIWWNYTFLDGNDYAPEERGKVVHLEIVFEREGDRSTAMRTAASELRPAGPMSITYVFAAGKT